MEWVIIFHCCISKMYKKSLKSHPKNILHAVQVQKLNLIDQKLGTHQIREKKKCLARILRFEKVLFCL